ncbi:MAG: MFS transporter [Acholeplasmataceae bacterium]|jgi:DHA1 family multidrug resistance protein-like MFS transporter
MKKFIILAFVFITGFAQNLAHPVTSKYLQELGINAIWFGIFYAAMQLGIFLTAPYWGNFGNRVKRKYVMMIGYIGYGIAQTLFAYFSTPGTILFARFLAGFFSGAIMSNAYAYIAEDEDFDNKKALLTLAVALNAFGGSVAFLFGGHMANNFWANNQVIYFQGIFCIIMALATLLLDTKKPEGTKEKKKGVLRQIGDIGKLSPTFILLFVIIVISSIAFSTFQRFIERYVIEIGRGTDVVGNMGFIHGLVGIGITLLLVPLLNRKFKPITLIIFSLLAASVFSLLTFVLPNKYIMTYLFTIYIAYIISKAIYDPSLVNHVSENKTVSSGLLMGMHQSGISLGAIIGPVIAGFIYEFNAIALFIALSSLLFVSFLLSLFYRRKSTSETVVTNISLESET